LWAEGERVVSFWPAGRGGEFGHGAGHRAGKRSARGSANEGHHVADWEIRERSARGRRPARRCCWTWPAQGWRQVSSPLGGAQWRARRARRRRYLTRSRRRDVGASGRGADGCSASDHGLGDEPFRTRSPAPSRRQRAARRHAVRIAIWDGQGTPPTSTVDHQCHEFVSCRGRNRSKRHLRESSARSRDAFHRDSRAASPFGVAGDRPRAATHDRGPGSAPASGPPRRRRTGRSRAGQRPGRGWVDHEPFPLVDPTETVSTIARY
jgi:hypothetical protein